MKKNSFFDLTSFDFHISNVLYNRAAVGSFKPFSPRRTCELVYKIDGTSEQFFDGQKLMLVPDSVFFIPKGSVNSQRITAAGTVLNIFFDILGDADFPPEILPLSEGNPYKSMFLSAEEIWRKRDTGYYLNTLSVVSKIFACLVREREKKYMHSGKYALIAPAMEYIHENYRGELSVSGLAKMCGISDEYFRTLFRNFTGQNPLGYINNLRLEHAREMLVSGTISVAKAAEASGFQNTSYFSRLFSRHYSVPPSRAADAAPVLPGVFRKSAER